MIKELNIKNFAIIEDLSINFEEGFSVLTGQTGAGKSLLIDTLSLLLGQRADADLIRSGEDKAIVYASFSYQNPKIDEILKNYDFEILDNLTIYREITKSKNTIKINNQVTSLQVLKQLVIHLGDLHMQNDNYKLFSQENYLSFIDPLEDKKFNDLLSKYSLDLNNYLNDYNVLNDVIKRKNESLKNKDYLEYVYNEIDKLNLKENEDIQIEEEINKLSNFDKIFSSLKESYELLNNEYFNLDNLYDAYTKIEKITKYDSSLEEVSNNLNTSYDLASEALSSIEKTIKNLDFDPNHLDELNLRINEINNLKLKYHKSLNELILYKEEIKLSLDLSNDFDNVLQEKEENLKKSYDKLIQSANLITEYRKKIAKNVEKAIIKEANDLNLLDTKLEIRFLNVDYSNYKNKEIFKENGCDQIDFYVSFNEGEELHPLSKVASGGELSRIMLSFKSYFASQSKLSFMVFDEIDTGVSGEVAFKIAKKMKEISKYVQVISITHLPQVAALADHQLYIYKEVINKRTYTRILKLDLDKRIEVIAKMISGEVITNSALEAAKEMLKSE